MSKYHKILHSSYC